MNVYNLIGHYYYINEYPVGVIRKILPIGTEKEYILTIDNIGTRTVTHEEMGYLMSEFEVRSKRFKIVDEKSIDSLIHFTNARNLNNILQYGLLSNDSMDSKNIVYYRSDDFRLDGKTNYICNTISFPNYKMFYSKIKNTEGEDWIVLDIDRDIIIHKLSTEFYRNNAASNNTGIISNKRTNEALLDMFYDDDNRKGLPSYYPTNPQAEVLVKESIKSSYIRQIYTNSISSEMQAMCKDAGKKLILKPGMYAPRYDWERW